MIQQTSLLAYAEVKPHLNDRQQAVHEVIGKYQPICNREIARRLRWEINRVTPRVLELRTKGVVEQDRVDVDRFGRRVNYWRLAD